jgi:anaphase-promoting complex subunit 3
VNRIMSPPAGVNAQLRHLVHYHLDNGLLENALFFATRLHAQDPRSGDATHLLALCSLRLGRYKAAFDYAKPKAHQPLHLGCTYVFAQACLGLERYDAGAQALEKSRGLWASRNHWSKHSAAGRFGGFDIDTLQTNTRTLRDDTYPTRPPVTACWENCTAPTATQRKL